MRVGALVPPRPGGPLFLPGILGRMWRRLWPFFAFYAAATPADTMRTFADNWGLPVHRQFSPIESAALTDAPTHALQNAFLWSHALQVGATEVYMSWFLVPMTAAIPVLLYRPHQYTRFIAYLLVTYYAVMPLFFLYPLEPPWMHDPGIIRVVTTIIPQAAGKDPNPYAAMPSLHVALPLSAALWYGWRYWFGKLLFGYAALIALVVVFSGDHYVADVAASGVLSVSIYLAVRHLRLPLLPDRWAPLPSETTPSRAGAPLPAPDQIAA